MKTISFNVERNYRISNDDQYMKARFSQEVVPDENETTEDAALRAIKQMDNIFRIAYPHVAEHLNFHVERQLNNYVVDEKVFYKSPTAVKEQLMPIVNPEPISKGTIEEQSGYKYPVATTETIIKEMKSYKLGAKAFKAVYELQVKDNPELKEIFENKLKELTV